MWETWVWSLGREDPVEKGMATHSSVLAWRIPWTEATVHGVTKSWTGLTPFWVSVQPRCPPCPPAWQISLLELQACPPGDWPCCLVFSQTELLCLQQPLTPAHLCASNHRSPPIGRPPWQPFLWLPLGGACTGDPTIFLTSSLSP